MSAKELLAEIAKMTGLPEEKVEGVISAFMERMAEAPPPSLTGQLISEIRQLSHQIGRIEGSLSEFKESVRGRFESLESRFREFREWVNGRFAEFREAVDKRFELLERRLDRLERWLFAFLIPILLALLSLVARAFLFSP